MSDEEGGEKITSIRKARIAAGFTVTEAARRMGIAPSYVSKLDAKGTRDLNALMRCANAYNVPVTQLTMSDNPACGRGRKSKKA